MAQAVTPSVTLRVNADRFHVAAGKSVDIAVDVQRLDGFKLPLQISLVDIPKDAACPAVTSEPKGKTAKSVTLKLTAGKSPFSGAMRVEVRTTSPAKTANKPVDATVRHASYALPNSPRVLERLWLTIE